MNGNEYKNKYENINDFLSACASDFVTAGQKSETARRLVKSYKNAASSRENFVVLHGLWAHEKAFAAHMTVQSFLLCPQIAKWPEIAEITRKFMKIAENRYIINKRTFSRITDYGDPDGILSLARLKFRGANDFNQKNGNVVFVLDGLVKPGNIGVIIRACDGAGVGAILVCGLRTSVTHPNAIKASMGAAFTVPIIRFDGAAACKKWLMENGYQIYVADPAAETRYDKPDYSGKIAVVMGNEHIGADRVWYDGSSKPFFIPMSGTCDSLNVSVAAAILAYEIQRKRLG